VAADLDQALGHAAAVAEAELALVARAHLAGIAGADRAGSLAHDHAADGADVLVLLVRLRAATGNERGGDHQGEGFEGGVHFAFLSKVVVSWVRDSSTSQRSSAEWNEWVQPVWTSSTTPDTPWASRR
jgi:hypothetical protein